MSWFTRLVNVFRRRDLNREIDEELRFHLDATFQDNLDAGMTPAEARRQALARFGSRGRLREETRDANVLVHVERLWQDLRHGARMFAKNPGLTSVAVISIAFGTGANVAIFSVAQAHLLRPLPVARPSELLTVGSSVQFGRWIGGPPAYRNLASYPDYEDIRDRARSFQDLVAYDFGPIGLTTRAGETPQVRVGTFVTQNFFHVLGIEPAIGRSFRTTEDGTQESDAVVVLSHPFWRAEFAGDPAVIGRRVRVGGLECAIVGIAPQSFTGLEPYVRDEVFLPITMLARVADLSIANPLDRRDARILTVKGRLRRGVSQAEAQAELATIGRDLEREHPATNRGQSPVAQTEFEYSVMLRPLDAQLILLLTILSVGVLAVSCANVAGLLASRGPVRAREMALRLAMGAHRARLIRQLMTESLGIAIVGAVGGLFVGQIGIGLLRHLKHPSGIFTSPVYHLDGQTLLFNLAVAVMTALIVGLGPAWQATRVDLTTSLKATEKAGTSRRRWTGRSVLVALQVSLSLVLLTIALFSVRFFSRQLETGPGFRISHIAKAAISPGQARYTEAEAGRFFADLLEQARALPGVRSASVASAMPMTSFSFAPIVPEGYQLAEGQADVPVWTNSVDEQYFSTLDIPLLHGRLFEPTDDANAPRVVIVNDTLARHYWAGSNPIGKQVILPGRSSPSAAEVVGIVKTTTYGLPGEQPQEAIFLPYRQQPHGRMTLLVRTSGDSAALLDPLRQLVERIDRDVPVSELQTIEAFYELRIVAAGNILVGLITAMGLMGLTLTMVGLYGLVSYAVNRRTREIGIRIAIGASYSRIVTMVLRQGMAPAWLGLAAGLVLSGVTGRLMMQAAPFPDAVDIRSYAFVVPIVAAVTALAAFIPARRAAQVNPTVALRCE